jgi:hypothetical protein
MSGEKLFERLLVTVTRFFDEVERRFEIAHC